MTPTREDLAMASEALRFVAELPHASPKQIATFSTVAAWLEAQDIREDTSDKPPMPDHDYARQWALDTLSGRADGGRFAWGERNLALAYVRLTNPTPPETADV